MRLVDERYEAEYSGVKIKTKTILDALKELTQLAKTHILLVVDELGKNLEYAARHQGQEDLYLLQQIAELELKGEHQVYFIGLLHQSFGGYSDRLSVTEQNEWNKIQGRFEDIPFSESPNQMTRLIGQVIDRTKAEPIEAVSIECELEREKEANLSFTSINCPGFADALHSLCPE